MLKLYYISLKVVLIIFIIPSITWAFVPAFPGAEGGGAESIGGRGGRIIEVTNLNNCGPGSFRAACEASGPRIVVFRVAGIIDLDGKRIIISNPYITIAGQTAPEGGITIKGHELRIKTHDVIIRYIRVRTGRRDDFSKQEGDAIALVNDCYNVIIDHCSLSWSNDENAQIWSEANASHHITFSWNLIAEGLTYNHGSCGFIAGSNKDALGIHDISIHHNLFMNNDGRSPFVKCRDARIINNLIYNWHWCATEIGGGIKVDIIGNKYKMGPETKNSRSWEVNVRPYKGSPDFGPPGDPSIYIANNLGPHQNNPDGDNWNMLWVNMSNPPVPPNRSKCRRLTPLKELTPPITVHSVLDIKDIVLDNVGANKRLDENGSWVSDRDAVDSRLIDEYLNGKGRIPIDESSVKGYPTIAPSTPHKDSDHDGMPDAWETAKGLNPKDPSDALRIPTKIYTNVEKYLNGSLLPPSNIRLEN